MFSVLMQQDPRLSEAFNMLISDFGGMGGAAAAAGGFGGASNTQPSQQ